MKMECILIFFSQLHLKIQQTLCVKCTFFFWIMIFFFSSPSFHFEICAHLPPGRHTMILYCDILEQQRGLECKKTKKKKSVIFWTRVCVRGLRRRERQTCGHGIIGPRFAQRRCYCAPRRGSVGFFSFLSSNIQCVLEINSDVLSKTRSSILLFPIGGHL